jgi:hypothetical protein
MGHFDQHLRANWLRGRDFDFPKRRSAFDNCPGSHYVIPDREISMIQKPQVLKARNQFDLA